MRSASPAKKRFFDASNGFEQVPERRCDQVDDGGERGDVAIAARTRPGGWKRPLSPSRRALLWDDVQRCRIRVLWVSTVARALRTGSRMGSGSSSSLAWRRKLVIRQRAA